MNRHLFALLSAIWFSAGPVWGQISGTITATSSDCSTTGSCVRLPLPRNTGSVSVNITGTWTATNEFEGAAFRPSGGGAFVNISCAPYPSGASITSTTANGTWLCSVAGLTEFRVRASAYTSGTATVSLQDTAAMSKSIFQSAPSFASLTPGSVLFAGTGGVVDDSRIVRIAEAYSGADAGAQIAACIADLPSAGGTCDARGLEGAQAITSDIFNGTTKPVILLLGKATFTTSAEIRPSSGSEIIGVGRETVIYQANSANLTHVITTASNVASRVRIANLLVDGNAANQTSGSSLVLLSGHASSTANIIENSWLENSEGHAVFLANGTDAVVRNNRFTSIGNQPIAIEYSSATSTRHKVEGNFIDDYIGFGIGVVRGNENIVRGNTVRGILRSGTVDTSGTAVTHVSGENFSTLRAGHTIKINRVEYTISTVNSTTSITLTSSAGTQSGVAYAAGAFEAINLNSAQANLVYNNVVQANADSGIVLHAAASGQSNANNIVQGNYITNVAAVGVSLDASGGNVTGNQILGNTIFNVVVAPNAMATNFDVGIRIAAASATRNYVAENTVTDDRGGSATHQYAVAFDTVGANNQTGPNFSFGSLNSGIRGDSSFSTLNLPDASSSARGLMTTGTQTIAGVKTLTGAALNLTASTASLEVGSNGGANSPLLDFHSSGLNSDYDVRLQASGGTSSVGNGVLQITATQVGIGASPSTRFALGGTGSSNGITFGEGAANPTNLYRSTTDTLKTDDSFIIGSSGTAILTHLSATASLDFTALAANSCEVLTITVTGAADGDVVDLGIPNALADVDGATERTTFFGWVSSSNTVSVRRCNVTGAATAEPSAATVRASVTRY